MAQWIYTAVVQIAVLIQMRFIWRLPKRFLAPYGLLTFPIDLLGGKVQGTKIKQSN